MAEKQSDPNDSQNQDSSLDPRAQALFNAIRERSAQDPLVGAKIGGKEILQRLLDAMKNERGVHAESLMCVLGALAGYACQACLRAQAVTEKMHADAAFHVMETDDGGRYFFGDPLNNLLISAKYSVWGLAGAAAQQAGVKDLLDLNDIFAHTASALGTPLFGVPRVPENHRAGDLPINYLKALWPQVFPTIQQFCPNPAHWPILLGLAIQEAINMSISVLSPDLSLKMVMESAIPMSKVDLSESSP
ncbi:hypothetical protein LJC47_06595 [Desulfosarcina sp. OttesenSCG-928-B08]|nr:hypothetical protein [Desulfosarcina sp. OttesenSCG-928-B08]